MLSKVTVSAGGVVINGQKMILVVNQNGTSWSLPKGHVDLGEEPLQAAIREITEESGVDDLHFLRGCAGVAVLFEIDAGCLGSVQSPAELVVVLGKGRFRFVHVEDSRRGSGSELCRARFSCGFERRRGV